MAAFVMQLVILAVILFWSWVQTKLNRSMLKRIEQLEKLFAPPPVPKEAFRYVDLLREETNRLTGVEAPPWRKKPDA